METQITTILDNAYQNQIYGGEFHIGKNFRIRFYVNNHIIFKSVYIPFGPVVTNKEGVDEFFTYLDKLRFTKLKIDLPLMLDSELITRFQNYFLNMKFVKTNYVHDNETLLVTPKNFQMSSRNQRYVRSSLKDNYIHITTNLTAKELDSIYDIYTESAMRVGYKPKAKEVLKEVASKGITAIAKDKLNDEVKGFLIGYLNKSLNNILEAPSHPQVLQLIFTGITESGMKNKLGFGIHYEFFQKCFNDFEIDIIDFHGASRTQNRSYTAFKQAFGGEFLEMPGSFEKFIIY